MFKKMTIAACFAGALMMVSAPASAAAYLIGGKWYFFSLDFESTLAKVTGKDLKDITTVAAKVEITRSEIQCANPQGNLVDPGQGPKVVAYGTSEPVTESDLLTRADNKVTGNVYKTKTEVALPKDPAANPCKDPAGVAEWLPTYWRNDGCNRGTESVYDSACYSDRAVKINGILVYTSTRLPVGDDGNWTFVYLPTVFTYDAKVQTGTGGSSQSVTGTCNFPLNNEAGALSPPQPYSLGNPPASGWAVSPVSYVCTGF